MTLRFRVDGTPAPKGSLQSHVIKRKDGSLVTRANGQPVIVSRDQLPTTRPWMALVKDAARQAIGGMAIPFVNVPLAVRILFWMPRPQSLPKRRPSAPIGARNDADKLQRAVFDALKGIVWMDDGQVVEAHSVKAYCALNRRPGADIEITALDLGQWVFAAQPERATVRDLPEMLPLF